ncbi:hypothetical protein AAVH_36671 [Aphelenchoides avenae]|nr:hypothetical protein AAVH_36671 [Aphelenchus avenae]
MTFTEQQATAILDRICKAFEEAHEKKDAKRMAQLYHPRATMIHVGVKCDYGREAIEKAYEQLWQQGIKGLKLHPESNHFTEDGEYVVQRGKMTFEGATHKFRYETVAKKADDGAYLLYHDEFGLDA